MKGVNKMDFRDWWEPKRAALEKGGNKTLMIETVFKLCSEAYQLAEEAQKTPDNKPNEAIARIKHILRNFKHFDLRQIELTLADIVEQQPHSA